MSWDEVCFAGNVRAGHTLLVEGTFRTKSSLWAAVRRKRGWSGLIPNLIIIFFKHSYFTNVERLIPTNHCVSKERSYNFLNTDQWWYSSTNIFCPSHNKKEPTIVWSNCECHTDFCLRGSKGSSVLTDMENIRNLNSSVLLEFQEGNCDFSHCLYKIYSN